MTDRMGQTVQNQIRLKEQSKQGLHCLPFLLHPVWKINHIFSKPTKRPVHLAKTRISLGISPFWSESSLSVWRKLGSSATHWTHSEDSDQVLSWGGSNCSIFSGVWNFQIFVTTLTVLCPWQYCRLCSPRRPVLHPAEFGFRQYVPGQFPDTSRQ